MGFIERRLFCRKLLAGKGAARLVWKAGVRNGMVAAKKRRHRSRNEWKKHVLDTCVRGTVMIEENWT